MKVASLVVATAFVASAFGIAISAHQGQGTASATPALPASAWAPQTPTDKFDPTRDAAKDIAYAVALAKRTKRNVVLDVGGEWCSWCHILDKYFAEHADLRETRDKLYVWTKVNWSPENKNEAILSKYPAIKGYPHLFVLDQEGKLLQSQDTSLLEEKSSYNFDKMKEFLAKWAVSEK